ncbi:transposase [Microseira sp. BLCC-F43]|uniref:transposase n=1 Tax=Microseira sp. BLCC-F43 TaxID=3153602 RepID=UPI0035B9422E
MLSQSNEEKKNSHASRKTTAPLNSCTSGWSLHQTKRRITITDKKGIGELKLVGKWDIHNYPAKLIKRVRLVRRADGYYCQFAIDVECFEQLQPTGNAIGLDVGLEFFYTDSNRHQEENPRFSRKAEQSIKHAQRLIYKKEKGKNGRRKARRRFAKKHLRVRCDSLCGESWCKVHKNYTNQFQQWKRLNSWSDAGESPTYQTQV